MNCDKHQWHAPGPCLDCESEAALAAQRLDLAAMASIPAAYKLAMLDVYGAPGEERKLTHEAIATHAYQLGRAMLAERSSAGPAAAGREQQCANTNSVGPMTYYCTLQEGHAGDHMSGVRWRRD